MKSYKSKYLIDGLSYTINEIKLSKCKGLILSIESGPTLLVDKSTLVQARKYGDKACFNYLSSSSKSISREEYEKLEQEEETYMEVKIRKRNNNNNNV